MSETNRRFLLRERPRERLGSGTFERVEEPIPEIADGEALVRVEWISLDPTNRVWLGETPTYLPPVGIGDVMRAVGLGRVMASKHPGYPEGQRVMGLLGWQEWAVVSDATPVLRPVPEIAGVPPTAYLGVLGTTGLTAWVGISDIGRPQSGETVVVSAAAGAVGSVAGQIAKLRGARIVGIAGGPDKSRLLTERLRFDAAVDRGAADWRDQLAEATPDGVDVDFENVGGKIMDAVFARLNLRARLWLCGDLDDVSAWRRTLCVEPHLVNSVRGRDVPEGVPARARVLRERGIDVLNMHRTDWRPAAVEAVREEGCLAFGWDVQTPAGLDLLLGMGCAGVYSDSVPQLLEALARRRGRDTS